MPPNKTFPENDPTHTYLDVNIFNNNIDPTNSNPIPVVFNTRRDADYLNNPNDYYMAVVRWSMDSRLPIIIPQINLDYNGGMYDPALGGYQTIYSVNLIIESSTVRKEYQRYISFVPQHQNSPHPLVPITSMTEVYNTPYFYIDSVQWWLLLVNQAIAYAWNEVRNDWLTNVGPLPATVLDAPPFILYNYDGNITMNAPPSYLSFADIILGRCRMYFNSSLYTLFNGLSAVVNGFDNTSPLDTTLGKNYLISFLNEFQTTTYKIATVDEEFVYMLSEYPVVPFWCPVSSLVFQSNTIPVEATNTAPTNIAGVPASIATINNNLNLSNIITDFDINLITGTESRQITYYDANPYRFFDLNSNRPIGEINISVLWKDKLTGSTHPFKIFSGSGGSIKILFRKKNFYSNV